MIKEKIIIKNVTFKIKIKIVLICVDFVISKKIAIV